MENSFGTEAQVNKLGLQFQVSCFLESLTAISTTNNGKLSSNSNVDLSRLHTFIIQQKPGFESNLIALANVRNAICASIAEDYGMLENQLLEAEGYLENLRLKDVIDRHSNTTESNLLLQAAIIHGDELSGKTINDILDLIQHPAIPFLKNEKATKIGQITDLSDLRRLKEDIRSHTLTENGKLVLDTMFLDSFLATSNIYEALFLIPVIFSEKQYFYDVLSILNRIEHKCDLLVRNDNFILHIFDTKDFQNRTKSRLFSYVILLATILSSTYFTIPLLNKLFNDIFNESKPGNGDETLIINGDSVSEADLARLTLSIKNDSNIVSVSGNKIVNVDISRMQANKVNYETYPEMLQFHGQGEALIINFYTEKSLDLDHDGKFAATLAAYLWDKYKLRYAIPLHQIDSKILSIAVIPSYQK